MVKNIQKHKRIFFVTLLIGVVALIPVMFLFRHGFFISDDGEWMVIRFSAFYQTLRDGQIPPRFFGRLNHGYGYPIGNFLYPGFFYLATPFKVIGFDFVEAVKAVIMLSFISSGIGAFLWLRSRFSDTAAFIGGLVYVYFPYHLYDVYARGSVGELVAFGVLPFLLIAIDRKQTIIAGFLLALLFLSHNTFALLVLPFLLVYVYLCGKRQVFFAFPCGLLLSAFFWLPSLVELPLTVFSRTVISDWGGYFLTWQNMTLLGIVGGVLLLGSLYALYRKKHTITLFFITTYFLGIFFAAGVSNLFWEIGILPKLVQFPWRFLLLCVWSGAFIAAYLVDMFTRKKQAAVILVILATLVLSALPQLAYLRPVTRDEGYYTTNEDTTTTQGEYMPVTVTKIPQTHPVTDVIVSHGEATITNQVRNSYALDFTAISSAGATLEIQKIYFPGWRGEINGNMAALSPGKSGYLTLELPPGTSVIHVDFGETPLRLAADVVSALTAGLLLVVLVLRYWFPSKQFLALYHRYLG